MKIKENEDLIKELNKIIKDLDSRIDGLSSHHSDIVLSIKDLQTLLSAWRQTIKGFVQYIEIIEENVLQ